MSNSTPVGQAPIRVRYADTDQVVLFTTQTILFGLKFDELNGSVKQPRVI